MRDKGTLEYQHKLQWAVQAAAAVFAVNPLIADMFAPHAKRVDVVPSGFDPARFPPELCRQHAPRTCHRILFAGLPNEYMKGFHVLRAAAEELWRERQDFRVVITGDGPDPAEPWADYVGWQSQDELPKLIASCDLLVFPTIAEEALGRSAVEAFACGLPVIASKIGGLQFVVADESRGLLFPPGDIAALITQIKRLLDNHQLRDQMGRNGRTYFETEFLWDDIIEKKYVPVLGSPIVSETAGQ